MADPSPLTLESPRLLLTLLDPADAARVVAYFTDNATHHARWNPPRRPSFATEEHWRTELAKGREDFAADRAVKLFLLRREALDGEVIGQVNLTQIFRGPFEACTLGYSLAGSVEGQGFMTEALSILIPWIFDTLGLHRIGANYLAVNQRSGRLLRRMGFVIEGYARNYLYIDGAWRDHVLTALTNPGGAPPRV